MDDEIDNGDILGRKSVKILIQIVCLILSREQKGRWKINVRSY